MLGTKIKVDISCFAYFNILCMYKFIKMSNFFCPVHTRIYRLYNFLLFYGPHEGLLKTIANDVSKYTLTKNSISIVSLKL